MKEAWRWIDWKLVNFNKLYFVPAIIAFAHYATVYANSAFKFPFCNGFHNNFLVIYYDILFIDVFVDLNIITSVASYSFYF